MNPRDTGLLPRLLRMLDSLEVDAEIANTVRRIRQTLGPGGFGDSLGDETIALRHDEPEITVRLRALGFMLRRASHPVPEIDLALHRTCEALVESRTVRGEDVVITLACLRDLLAFAADHVRPETAQHEPEPGAMNDLMASLNRLGRG